MEVPEELFLLIRMKQLALKMKREADKKTKRLKRSEEKEDYLSLKKKNKKQELPIQQKNREIKHAEKGVKAKKPGNSK